MPQYGRAPRTIVQRLTEKERSTDGVVHEVT